MYHPPNKPTRREPRRIGEVLADLLAQRGYAQTQAAEDCLAAWQSITGELARHALPGTLRRGVLNIQVRNSAVLQELTFRKQELLSQMVQTLPHHGIVDLRFRVGRVD